MEGEREKRRYINKERIRKKGNRERERKEQAWEREGGRKTRRKRKRN